MSRKNIKSAKKKKNEKQQKKQNQQQRQKVLENKSRYRAFLSTAQPQDILSLSPDIIRRFKDEEYRLYAKRLAQIGNKRITEIKKANIRSYAVDEAMNHGGKFKVNSFMDKKEIQKEVNRINSFLNKKSSTLEGLKKSSEKAQNTLSNKLGRKVEFDNVQENNFYDNLKEFRKNLPSSYFLERYNEIIAYVDDIITSDISTDVMLKLSNAMAKSAYIQYQNENNSNMSDTEEEFWKEFNANLEEREKRLNGGKIESQLRPKVYNEETYSELLNNEVIGSESFVQLEDMFWRSYYNDTDL